VPRFGRDFYIEHVERFRGSPADVERTILSLASTDGRATAIRLPQDPGQAGKAQAQTLVSKLAGYDVKATPVTGSKAVRATPAAAQAEAGNVKLVAGPWNEAFIEEVCGFPAATHDDQVDAFADALNALALPLVPTAASGTYRWN
jgi:predicted phage terminase large subunit-like protein